MKENLKNRTATQTSEFYDHLGYLFYAIAAVDNNVAPEEKAKFIELVNKDWSFQNDGIDSKKIIISKFNELVKKDFDKEEAFSSFRTFFLDNKDQYKEDVSSKIMDTADRIAISFSGRNKSESVLLSRLYHVLYK